MLILVQTDTTVGFLSQDALALTIAKDRPFGKNFITVYRDLASLKKSGIRASNMHKNAIRRAKKTTFIIKNHSFRVAAPAVNSWLLQKTEWFYSTSANQSGMAFDRDFCESKSDIIIENSSRLTEQQPSRLIKLNQTKRRRLR